jgi:hypothetical protein
MPTKAAEEEQGRPSAAEEAVAEAAHPHQTQEVLVVQLVVQQNPSQVAAVAAAVHSPPSKEAVEARHQKLLRLLHRSFLHKPSCAPPATH